MPPLTFLKQRTRGNRRSVIRTSLPRRRSRCRGARLLSTRHLCCFPHASFPGLSRRPNLEGPRLQARAATPPSDPFKASRRGCDISVSIYLAVEVCRTHLRQCQYSRETPLDYRRSFVLSFCSLSLLPASPKPLETERIVDDWMIFGSS